MLSLLTQDVHHPAVRAQRRSRPPLQDLIDEASDGRVEPLGIGEAVDHEALEHLLRVEDEQGTIAARVLDVDEAGAQLSERSLAVRSRGDDHRRLADDEPLGEEGSGGGVQPLVGGVKLHGVIVTAVARVRHQPQG